MGDRKLKIISEFVLHESVLVSDRVVLVLEGVVLVLDGVVSNPITNLLPYCNDQTVKASLY